MLFTWRSRSARLRLPRKPSFPLQHLSPSEMYFSCHLCGNKFRKMSSILAVLAKCAQDAEEGGGGFLPNRAFSI